MTEGKRKEIIKFERKKENDTEFERKENRKKETVHNLKERTFGNLKGETDIIWNKGRNNFNLTEFERRNESKMNRI